MAERPMKDHIAMMKGENEGGFLAWPMWPRLPLKRRHQSGVGYDTAFLVAGEGPVIGIGTIFTGADEIKGYQDFEAIYDDGWRVD